MSQERSPLTLSVYLESSLEGSPVSKLTVTGVSHPEWAANVLRRLMHIKKVTNFGSPDNDPTQYGVVAVYQHEKVSDITKFTALVRMAIENGSISPPHL